MDDKNYAKHLKNMLEAIEGLTECLKEAKSDSNFKTLEIGLEILTLKHKVITDMYKCNKTQ